MCSGRFKKRVRPVRLETLKVAGGEMMFPEAARAGVEESGAAGAVLTDLMELATSLPGRGRSQVHRATPSGFFFLHRQLPRSSNASSCVRQLVDDRELPEWPLADLGWNEERRRLQASSALDRLAHFPSLLVGRSCDTKGPQSGVRIARLRPRFSIRLTASTGATAAPTRPAPWRSSSRRPGATHTTLPAALRQPNQLTGSASRDRAPIYDLRGRARSARLPASPARRGIARR